MEQRILCVWLRGQEVFSSVIICRFPYSLFPICSAHIRHANSVPLAIPSVQKSRPYSEGKALGAHRGNSGLTNCRAQNHSSRSQMMSFGWHLHAVELELCHLRLSARLRTADQAEQSFRLTSICLLYILGWMRGCRTQYTLTDSAWGYEGQTLCVHACSHRQKIPGNMRCNTARN